MKFKFLKYEEYKAYRKQVQELMNVIFSAQIELQDMSIHSPYEHYISRKLSLMLKHACEAYTGMMKGIICRREFHDQF